MCWAVLFFPPYIMQFTNFETRVLWYMGSGTISRLTMCAFLGIEKPQTTANIRSRIHGPKSRLILGSLEYPQPGLAPGYRVFAGTVSRPPPAATPILLAASRHISSATASDSQHLRHPAS